MKIPEDHLRFHTSHGKKSKKKDVTTPQGRTITHLSASKLTNFFAEHVFSEAKREPRKFNARWINNPNS